jgi:hypothetical protein
MTVPQASPVVSRNTRHPTISSRRRRALVEGTALPVNAAVAAVASVFVAAPRLPNMPMRVRRHVRCTKVGDMSCPFCAIAPAEIIWESSLLIAIRDRFPLNPGHTLIIPRRHVSDWFGATGEERQQLLVAVDDVRALLERERRADGYSVGFNAGVAAGQTVATGFEPVIPTV